MKSKITKIQFLKRGILLMLILAMILPSSIYAVEGLTLQASTTFEKLMYGEIGSIVRKIEEHFKSNTTLYIVNENQLRALAEYVNNGNSCQGKKIELLNDIELDSNIDWVPIGNIYSEFSGTFNGNWYTISNLTYKVRENYQTEGGYSNVGLFGVVSKLGKVEKVNVNNSNIITSELDEENITNVGNIVGTNYGTISGCSANKMPLEKEKKETGESSNNYTGLIIGKNDGTLVKKSDSINPSTNIVLKTKESNDENANVNLKVYRKKDEDNYTEITNFFDRNDFENGETIKLEFIIEGYYLYTGLEEGQTIKLSDKIDSEGKDVKASADIYPLVTIGKGEKVAIATPISSLYGKKDETVPQNTLTYEYTVSSEKEMEVENSSIVMNFEKNKDDKKLYVYYSTDEEDFYTANKITGNATYEGLQINLDSKVPTVEIKASIGSIAESNRYTEGTEIIIKVKSSEKIQATIAPEINVSFSKSGLGKYNYQEDDKKGNAVHVDALLDAEGKTTWIYSYIIQNGDEGDLNIKYLSGTIKDLVGNEKDISEIETVKINTIYADTTAPTVTITKINDYNAKYDFNSDGVINNNDKELLSQYIKEITEKSEESKQINEATEQNQEQQEIENKIKLNGDINHDGKINVTDYEIFIKMFDEENCISNKSEISFNILWSEKLQAFDSSNISVINGKIKSLEQIGETQEYLLKIDTEVEDGNVGNLQIIIEQDAYKDLVGHGNIRTEKVIKVDKKAPILISLDAFGESDTKINSEIDIIKEFFKVGEKIEIVATFDENIVAEEIPDLILQFSESKNSVKVEGILDGNKIIYTYTISDGDKGRVSARSFSGTVLDIAGNETKVTKRELNGNTIIADTIAPILKELKVVSPETGVYKAENEITIEASFDEDIYTLENKEIKNITSENAPELKLKFGSGSEKTATAVGYGETEGKEDKTKIKYTYTIVDDDNGDLVIISYVNKQNIQVCDIAGNVATLNKNQTGNTITADTTRPTVENIIAVVENPTIGNTGIYHKAGNKIKITVTFSENVNSAVLQPKIQVGFSENEDEEPTTYKDKSYESDWNADSKTVEYTYDIEDGDNGYLWVKVPENQFKDEAGNKNISKEGTKLSNIYADTIIPTVTLYRDTEETQNNQIITVKAKFNENVYDLDDNTRISLTNSNAPKLIYSFGTGKNQEVGASSIDNEIITYTITKDSVKDNGDFHYELAKGNLCDRAGNELYKSSIDTTAPELKAVYITSDSTYGEYCKRGVDVEVIAQFDEEISNQRMELKFKIGNGQEQSISGEINNEDKTKIVFNYQVKDGDNGELTILDVQGNTLADEKLTDKTFGYVQDKHGNQKNIFDFDGITITGNAIADTIKPYIVKVEAKVNDTVIASYTKEDDKDAITTVGKINASEIEYVITFSELINYKGKIQIYNGAIKEIKNNDSDEDGYYNQVTVKVQPTIEGVQSLIISDGVFEDRAGNGNNAERFNLLTTDFTKPTIRFISEYNGGTYVMPTNIGKTEIRPNVEISEDIAKIEYKWENEDYTEINNYSTSSDIAIPTKAFTEAGTYKLSVKVQDLAGNISESSKTYKVINSNIDITLSTEEWTNENITATVEFGEGLTDNRKVTFESETTGEIVQKNAIGTDENGNTKYEITENGTLYVEATDRVGNKVFREENVTNIDTEAPTVQIDLNSADLVIGTGKNNATVKTKVTVKDNKILDSVKYAYIQESIDINNMTDEQKAKIDTDLNDEAKIENAVSTKDKPYYLYVIATDKAGNETIAKAGPFTVSDTNEREKIIEATETTPETKQTIPAEIEISKLISFEQKGKSIYITYNNFEETEEYLNIIKEKQISLTDADDGYYDYEYHSYVEVNKPTTITVKGKDECGNEVIATYEITRESIEGPEFEVYGNPEEWTNENVKLEVSCVDKLSALTVNEKDILANMSEIITENGDYKFIATDMYGMTSEKTIKVTKIDKDNPVISKTETSGKTIIITAEDATSEVAKYAITDTTEVPVEWSDSKEIKVTHDGMFYVWVMDNAGNVIRTEEVIIVDTTAPTITKVESKDKTITITAEDTTSGVAKYAITNTTEEPTQWSESNVITVEEDGKFYAWAMDGAGNVTKSEDIVIVDTIAPTITKVETSNKTITITATDTISGIAKYAITDTTEVPVEWSDSKVIKVTHDGIFYAWVMDNVGNITKSDDVVIVDTTSPTVSFSYTLLTVEEGLPIETNIITNEEAKILYSWDNKNWTTTEKYLTNVEVSQKYDVAGTYTLYAKAIDKFENESEIQSIKFSVIKAIDDIKEPEIIFEDLPIIQADGVKYVKVSADMTLEQVTAKMNKTALNDATPKYEKLTEDNKLKTGSEITLNGDTKYTVIVNGDVNCDGKVGPVDVTYANSIRLNKVNASNIQKLAADFDLDGVIKPIDITMINSYRLGKIKGI